MVIPELILEKSEELEWSSESEDEYELPLRPREDYKESRILKVRHRLSPFDKITMIVEFWKFFYSSMNNVTYLR